MTVFHSRFLATITQIQDRQCQIREEAWFERTLTNFIQKCIPFVSTVSPSVGESEEPFVLMIATNFNLSLCRCIVQESFDDIVTKSTWFDVNISN